MHPSPFLLVLGRTSQLMHVVESEFVGVDGVIDAGPENQAPIVTVPSPAQSGEGRGFLKRASINAFCRVLSMMSGRSKARFGIREGPVYPMWNPGADEVGSKVPVGMRSEEFLKETSVYRSGDGMLVNCRGNRNARDG